jgi:hypothetical protein
MKKNRIMKQNYQKIVFFGIILFAGVFIFFSSTKEATQNAHEEIESPLRKPVNHIQSFDKPAKSGKIVTKEKIQIQSRVYKEETFLEEVQDVDRERLLAIYSPPAKRVRYVKIKEGYWDAKKSPLFTPSQNGVFVLNLFEDKNLDVTVNRSAILGAGRYLVEGEVDGFPGSNVLITYANGAVSASVDLGQDEKYEINALQGNLHQVYELDPNLFPGDSEPLKPYVDENVIASYERQLAENSEENVVGDAEPGYAAATSGTEIWVDILFAYTNDMSANYSINAMTSRIDLAIAEANGAFDRSETRLRLRAVHLYKTDYDENGVLRDALERVRKTSDGFMDDVHEIRDQYGADLVCLLHDQSDSNTVGIAYLLMPPSNPFNEQYGFSVMRYGFLTGYNAFTHEIGHNLGCAHDRETATDDDTGELSEGAYSYSYGYRFNSSGNTYRTIMAYSPGSRLAYFSNPRLQFEGTGPSLGIPEGEAESADNARTIDQLAIEAANFRLSKASTVDGGRLVAVSTRAFISGGEKVLIGGFIIGQGDPKRVLIRGVGPSLSSMGIADVLEETNVKLFSGGSMIGENEHWRTNANYADILATPYPPISDLESALLVDLGPGTYTAHVQGVGNAAGVGLVEIYEIGEAGPNLIALSTRGQVMTGENVMIGGLVIVGSVGETKRVIIRGIGPSLSGSGVADAMDDPVITLYDKDGIALLENDDWDNSPQTDAIEATGFGPSNRRESVILIDLSPGIYTVIMKPFEDDDQTAVPGVGLIEAYEISGD